MLPILVSLGPIKIYSFGVCMALGIFVALYFWWKMGRDEHFDEIALFDSYFLSLLVFMIFGRLGYALFHTVELGSLYRILAILAYPGINVVIGLLVSLALMVLFARDHRWEVGKVLDAWVVGLATLLVFGSLGGILNGSGTSLGVDLWTFGWALATFVVVSKVRKNFRFYSWYKGEASVAKEGLASLGFMGLTGLFYLVWGLVDASSWRMGGVSVASVVGVVVMGVSGYWIYLRSGRKNTWVNLLQWLRQIRRR